MTTPIAAVSFDLDGTLYDLGRAKRPLLWATFPRWRTLRVGRRVREELRGRTFDSGEALLAEEARIVAERLDTNADDARRHLHDLFNVRLAAVLPRVGPRPEARRLLESLVGRGLPIAVISDRGAVVEKLTALGLQDLPWMVLASADDSGVLKPAAKLFVDVAARLGVTPDQMLHVGDRDDADGVGAREAGCQALIIDAGALSPLDAVLPFIDHTATGAGT